MSTDVGALRAGDIFHGRYTVLRRIASGGMGAVYEVVHGGTQRRCALKLMLPSLVAHEGARARFQSEATMAARIGSEHIVDVYDAGVEERTGIPFLLMELLEGVELGALVKRNGPLSVPDILTLMQQAALGLSKSHAAGIVHRDLKPENLFVTRRDDGSLRLKILDFGIARMVAESGHATKHTSMLGTPAYMAPEQIDADAPLGPAADLFALAHVVYTMLVGEIYWEPEADLGPYKLVLKVIAGIPEPPSVRALRRRGIALSPGFDEWFGRATAKQPDQRFSSATAQVNALADLLKNVPPPSVEPPSITERILATLPSPGAPAMPQTEPMLQIRVQPGATIVGAGTTTMPVSSDPITRRIERPMPPRQKWMIAGGVAASFCVLLGIGLGIRSAASDSRTRAGDLGEASLSSAYPEVPAPPATGSTGLASSAPAPVPTASVSASATGLSTTSASTPGPTGSKTRIGGKPQPKPSNTSNPSVLDTP